MAKPQKAAPAAAPPEPLRKATTKHAYRIERLSQFEFQAYQLTKDLGEDRYVEKIFGKADLLELVMRRIYEAAKTEANTVYQDNKKASNGAV